MNIFGRHAWVFSVLMLGACAPASTREGASPVVDAAVSHMGEGDDDASDAGIEPNHDSAGDAVSVRDGDAPDHREPIEPQVNQLADGAPSSSGEPDCVPSPELAFCDWLDSMDALVLARVDEISLAETPMYERVTGRYVESCDGTVLPALELRVSVVECWSGACPDTAVVRFGPTSIDSWRPFPARAADGSVAWLALSPAGGSPLEVGETYGFGLRAVEDGELYTGATEPIIVADTSGGETTLATRSNWWAVECGGVPVDAIEDMTLSSARDAVVRCPPAGATAVERAERMRLDTEESPDGAFAAVCAAMGTPLPVTCDDDSDCPPDEACNERRECEPRG